MKLTIEILKKDHEKKTFNCGNELLDTYLHKQSGQDARKNLSVCYVLTDKDIDEKKVLGYYTLSNNSVPWDDWPEELAKKIPKSYAIPTVLLGRLAVDLNEQGKDFGEILLYSALKKCFESSKQIGIAGVIVDPIDAKAVTFYERYGFVMMPDVNKMFITIDTLEDLFSQKSSKS
ncbi:hypothetical protein BB050_01477 [Flavobacterium anhuiense]|uniref:N-acetyltransferase domain-containing protein n=1 Tax=Flavobacterium anhuiense TaxID=459526 RepID=A0AAC9CYT5_9FLAO|nr:GNAT family N-acetyltransferase [Flavobacterium anhuiense]AOC94604.1 hypothetical protein BB050_01477 [Flavobacterium anhuiense]